MCVADLLDLLPHGGRSKCCRYLLALGEVELIVSVGWLCVLDDRYPVVEALYRVVEWRERY